MDNKSPRKKDKIHDYTTVQFHFTDRLRQFVIDRNLLSITYVEEFGRKQYDITITERP